MLRVSYDLNPHNEAMAALEYINLNSYCYMLCSASFRAAAKHF